MISRQEIERINRNKKRLRLTVYLAIALVVIIVAATVATTLIIKHLNESASAGSGKLPPEIIEGEGIYNGSALAYPTMEETDIKRITIKNKEGEYTLLRTEDSGGAFMLYYVDANGDTQVYYPSICEEDSSFEYESLYAIESSDGINRIYKLTYLCSALEYPYFSERIPLSDNPNEREFQLREYGFETDKKQTIVFDYIIEGETEEDEDKTVTHTIEIGAKNITGAGYYYRVDGRDCVYSTGSEYLSYALMGSYSYINSILVSAGIKEDSAFEPYLTTDYKQWVNEMHKNEGDEVVDGSKVIIFADMLVPIETTYDTKVDSDNFDGYTSEGYGSIEVDLSVYNKDSHYRRLVNSLVGKKVGKYYDPSDENADPSSQIIFTLTTDSKAIDLSDKASRDYKYSIVAIESIITDDGEIFTDGAAVGDNNLIKVSYYLFIDGKQVSPILYHAVLDLSREALPDAAVSELRGATVGELSEAVEISVAYDKDNSEKREIKYVITEIMTVYNQDGEEVDKISADSIITYHYRFEVDGVLGDTEYSAAINLKNDDSERGERIKEKLIGRSQGKKLSIVVDEYTEYCEYFSDFITYNVAEIKYFVTSEIVSSFRFQNNSDRDPFYGESIYENTLENKYKIYGLNSAVCEEVVKILGGIGDTTGESKGFVGIETVAIGITPEIMEEYGLYAHTVYFELPRGITVIENENEDEIDDYSWYETLGFTLYISDVQPDGTRYVGSALYDIVARVNAESLVFLEYDFINFWARKNLILTDIKNMQSFELEFFMDDLKGDYLFNLDHRTLYYTPDGKGYFTEPESYSDVFDFITVGVTPSGECTPNELTEYLSEKGRESMSLAELYKEIIGGGKDIYIGTDTYGTTYFKEAIQLLYNTRYEGSMTAEEQSEALLNSPMVMKFKVKLDSSSLYYTYEFYRVSDRRVMVRLYQADEDGSIKTTPVSDFYLSSFAFKKIVNAFVGVLNAEEIDPDVGYSD